jgi:hypothetical protein
MNYYTNLPSNGASKVVNGESDLDSVAAMAAFAFGPVITENAFIRQNLPAVVVQLVRQSQVTTKFAIKAVHSILAFFGVNTRGLRKHGELRMFMEAAFLHICYRNNVHEEGNYPDRQTLVDAYGAQFFEGLGDREVLRLLKYRNYMQIAVRYIHPNQNRDYLLDLVTRLSEGCSVRHVPGSGATLATRNRIGIYRKEGCVQKMIRVPRARLVSAELLPPISATAPLKRGRSLHGGGIPADESELLNPKRGCFGARAEVFLDMLETEYDDTSLQHLVLEDTPEYDIDDLLALLD